MGDKYCYSFRKRRAEKATGGVGKKICRASTTRRRDSKKYAVSRSFNLHTVTHTHTHTHTHTLYNHFTALLILSGTTCVSRYQKKHSPTHTCHGHQSSLISFLHLLWSMASSLFNLRAWQSFSTVSKFSLVCLLAWHPLLHTLLISSPNHCLLFAAHANTIATCFAVLARLCHLILVSLSTLYLELYLVA